MRSRAGSICGGSPPSSASEERRTPSLVRRLTKRRLRARHSPDGFTYASPCSSLFAPFFTRFRGDSGCDNPQKPLCFQSVGQKARSLAEQALNRETIRLIREIILPDKGRSREITGQDRPRPQDTFGEFGSFAMTASRREEGEWRRNARASASWARATSIS